MAEPHLNFPKNEKSTATDTNLSQYNFKYFLLILYAEINTFLTLRRGILAPTLDNDTGKGTPLLLHYQPAQVHGHSHPHPLSSKLLFALFCSEQNQIILKQKLLGLKL